MTFSQVSRGITLAFLAATLGAGCGGGGGGSSETAGTSVSLQARIAAPAAATVTNSEGVKVVLQKAYFVLWSVELNSTCNDPGFASAPRRLLDWLVPTAEAHAESTPTKIGVPHVINMLDTSAATLALGTLNPAVGNYCGLTVELIRADADAVGLPTGVDMINRLLYLSGTWQSGGAATPFEIVISKSGAPAKLLLRPNVSLSAQNLQAQTGVAIDPSRWFNGLDFTQLDTTVQQDLLLSNIRASMTAF